MRRGALLFALLLPAGCRCPAPPLDMRPAADSSSSLDLAEKPDACLACDAVLNPCPQLGLFCDPLSRCCTASPR